MGLLIRPEIRGFVCLTAHPVGCAAHVEEKIAAVRKAGRLPGPYRQRGTNSLQRLSRSNFAEFTARYEADYARRLGHSGLQRITRAVERSLECGDYSKGVARIRPTG